MTRSSFLRLRIRVLELLKCRDTSARDSGSPSFVAVWRQVEAPIVHGHGGHTQFPRHPRHVVDPRVRAVSVAVSEDDDALRRLGRQRVLPGCGFTLDLQGQWDRRRSCRRRGRTSCARSSV